MSFLRLYFSTLKSSRLCTPVATFKFVANHSAKSTPLKSHCLRTMATVSQSGKGTKSVIYLLRTVVLKRVALTDEHVAGPCSL